MVKVALDPRISLAATVPDIGRTFSNILTNVASLDAIKENRKNQGLRQQALQDLQSQRQAQTEGLQLGNISTRDTQRINSLGVLGAQIKPFLDAQDTQGALQIARANKQRLVSSMASGVEVDTTETDQLISILESGNVPLASQLADQAVNLANQFSGRSGRATPKASAPIVDPATGKVFQTVFDPATGQSTSQPVQGAPLQLTPQQKQEQAVKQRFAVEDIETKAVAKRETIKLKARRTSEITKELSTRNRDAARNGVRLRRALLLAQKSEQGLTAEVKIGMSKIFPNIDVTDEASLDSALLQLSLDQLQNFKGPTTDFEFGVAASTVGSLGDSKTANIARIKSLDRARWFNQREFDQFKRHTKSGGDPDDFSFNFGEPVKTKKGVFTLQDLQDSAVQNNLTIEEVIKRLNQQ